MMGGKIVELTFAEKNNAQNVFKDIREMATSPLPDAVYVASPNSLRYKRFFLP